MASALTRFGEVKLFGCDVYLDLGTPDMTREEREARAGELARMFCDYFERLEKGALRTLEFTGVRT